MVDFDAKRKELAAFTRELEAVDEDIAQLRNAYEQYFLGLERKPPVQQHTALKKRVQKLKTAFVRQTALKFRLNTVEQKFQTYERLWARSLMEIENGTYRRDLTRLKRKVEPPAPRPKPAAELPPEPEESAPAQAAGPQVAAKGGVPPQVAAKGAVPPQAQVPGAKGAVPPLPQAAARAPGAPAAAARAPGAPASRPPGAPVAARPPAATGVSEDKLKAVFDAYVVAKRRCQEDTSKLSYESVASTLRKQVPELMKKHGAKEIEFKVVIKDGKAVLRAVPK